MLVEAITIIIAGAILLAVGYAGYLGGRDSSERRAFATISTLRADLARERLESDRLREHNRLMADRIDRARLPRSEAPEWIQ